MNCVNPILIKGKNGRNFVPCGKCVYCLKRKHNEWQFRLKQEHLFSKVSFVVTLTYSDSFLPFDTNGIPNVSKDDVRTFIQKLRYVSGKKLRYYFVSEYGPQNLRPHYHGIVFFPDDYVTHDEFFMWCHNSWKKCEMGCLKTDVLNDKAINYVSKYVMKLMKIPDFLIPSFCLMSRRPGIGSAYLLDKDGNIKPEVKKYHKPGFLKYRTYVTQENGFRVNLPRFYRDKLFSKLDKFHINLDNSLRLDRFYDLVINHRMNPVKASNLIYTRTECDIRQMYQYYNEKRKL